MEQGRPGVVRNSISPHAIVIGVSLQKLVPAPQPVIPATSITRDSISSHTIDIGVSVIPATSITRDSVGSHTIDIGVSFPKNVGHVPALQQPLVPPDTDTTTTSPVSHL